MGIQMFDKDGTYIKDVSPAPLSFDTIHYLGGGFFLTKRYFSWTSHHIIEIHEMENNRLYTVRTLFNQAVLDYTPYGVSSDKHRFLNISLLYKSGTYFTYLDLRNEDWVLIRREYLGSFTGLEIHCSGEKFYVGNGITHFIRIYDKDFKFIRQFPTYSSGTLWGITSDKHYIYSCTQTSGTSAKLEIFDVNGTKIKEISLSSGYKGITTDGDNLFLAV